MGAYDETDDFGYAVVKDWPVMRLGETYLLRAEARFRQGNTQGRLMTSMCCATVPLKTIVRWLRVLVK